jgi:hypothetical protein
MEIPGKDDAHNQGKKPAQKDHKCYHIVKNVFDGSETGRLNRVIRHFGKSGFINFSAKNMGHFMSMPAEMPHIDPRQGPPENGTGKKREKKADEQNIPLNHIHNSLQTKLRPLREPQFFL